MTKLPDLYAEDALVQELDLVAEMEEKRELWRKQRMCKFTSSEAHRLMTGIDQTEEEAINSLVYGRAKVEDLKQKCEEHGIPTDGMKQKKDYAKALVYKGIIPHGVYAWPDGADTYVIEKLIEELTGEPYQPDLNTLAIQHGKEYEVEAMERMVQELNMPMEKYGEDQEFIDKNHPLFDKSIPEELHDYIGGTPDGKAVGKPIGGETKCPNKNTHFMHKMNMATSEDVREQYKEAYWQCQSTMYLTAWVRMYLESYDPRYQHAEDQRLILAIDRNEADIKLYEIRLKMAVERYKELKKAWIERRKTQ